MKHTDSCLVIILHIDQRLSAMRLDLQSRLAKCASGSRVSLKGKGGRRLTFIQIIRHLGLFILAVLHRVVHMTEDGVD